ncbi:MULTISPECIES: glycolate oxidase subunit GlcE [unclassified Thioalkalivibrio]|uniref:glycolate oxidase subunit GlcE n=1 Tax=unclassified Thioalkalivibrio TaxID=2621013 RepID=UPI000380FEE6|nr:MULTISPECIES: glycolate oxidase subunit GlcE [unclassified Thioalkalivibrio]
MSETADHSQELARAVREAADGGRRLWIAGGGTRAAIARPDPLPADVETLDVTAHRGITHLAPSELVVSVRAGTPLAELQAELAAVGMMLPFEPGDPGPGATVGGMVATGLSGPRRPWTASLRDAVLGTRVINGSGEILRFGGEVMKNVAGFDVSRLMAGSLGGLGVLLEVSFKLLPRPAHELTLQRNLDAAGFIDACRELGRTALPLSGLAWNDGRMYLRLSGGEQAVTEAAERLGDAPAADGEGFWSGLRDHRAEPFTREPAPGERLWRIVVPPATPPPELPGEWLLNWGGGERWLRSEADPARVRTAVEAAGGHARIWHGDPAGAPRLHPRGTALEGLEARVRQSMDPEGMFHSPLLPGSPARATGT